MTFALGTTLWEKIIAVFYQITGCKHDGQFHLNVGDSDHDDWYCFRCMRRT